MAPAGIEKRFEMERTEAEGQGHVIERLASDGETTIYGRCERCGGQIMIGVDPNQNVTCRYPCSAVLETR